MSEINWKAEIVRLAMIKQSIAAADHAKALPWALPNVAASEDELGQVEQALSQPLAHGYKEFLRHANGWAGFCVLTDLFGTRELVSERAQAARSRPDLLAFCRDNNLDAARCVVIGDSPNDLNMFAMFREQPESIVWLCGEEVDRYNSFSEFFSAMIAYNEQVLRRLTNAS